MPTSLPIDFPHATFVELKKDGKDTPITTYASGISCPELVDGYPVTKISPIKNIANYNLYVYVHRNYIYIVFICLYNYVDILIYG